MVLEELENEAELALALGVGKHGIVALTSRLVAFVSHRFDEAPHDVASQLCERHIPVHFPTVRSGV